MSSRVYFRGSREEARQVVHDLVGILTGHVRDTRGIAKGVFLAIGFAALSDIKKDFERKAAGGTGEDGETWPKLSPKYLAYQRRFGRGEKKELKAAAGLGAGHKFGVAGNKGLLTKDQQKRWNQIFARSVNRFLLSLPPAEAKARAAQIAWATLKSEGAKTMLEVYGYRQVEILRDTGVLLNSLSPGYVSGGSYQKPSLDGGDQQIFETIANGVVVGTNVPYAASHNHGDKRRGIPKRQFLPEVAPAVWLERWAAAANDALLAAARLAFQAGGV